jgi:hypothetical protein
VTRAANAGHKSILQAWRAQQINQGSCPSHVPQSPFASVSTVSRGHPSLVSPVEPYFYLNRGHNIHLTILCDEVWMCKAALSVDANFARAGFNSILACSDTVEPEEAAAEAMLNYKVYKTDKGRCKN